MSHGNIYDDIGRIEVGVDKGKIQIADVLERMVKDLEIIKGEVQQLKLLRWAPTSPQPSATVERHSDEMGDVCTQCGGPILHKEPHTVCDSCREENG